MTNELKTTDYWHPILQCRVTAMAYDFTNHEGRLDMAVANCCDMQGCIDLFISISPEVQLIETFAGGRRDTLYLRVRDGWSALSRGRSGWER